MILKAGDYTYKTSLSLQSDGTFKLSAVLDCEDEDFENHCHMWTAVNTTIEEVFKSMLRQLNSEWQEENYVVENKG